MVKAENMTPHLYANSSAHRYHLHVSQKTLYICVPTSVSKQNCLKMDWETNWMHI